MTTLTEHTKRIQREAKARYNDRIARDLGTTTAQLVVLMKAKNGKRPGGIAAIAAERHGLITRSLVSACITPKGEALLAKARAQGF